MFGFASSEWVFSAGLPPISIRFSLPRAHLKLQLISVQACALKMPQRLPLPAVQIVLGSLGNARATSFHCNSVRGGRSSHTCPFARPCALPSRPRDAFFVTSKVPGPRSGIASVRSSINDAPVVEINIVVGSRYSEQMIGKNS